MIRRYSVCSGGSVSIGSWRTLRTVSSDGIGTRNAALELRVFQSRAASRIALCPSSMGTGFP